MIIDLEDNFIKEILTYRIDLMFLLKEIDDEKRTLNSKICFVTNKQSYDEIRANYTLSDIDCIEEKVIGKNLKIAKEVYNINDKGKRLLVIFRLLKKRE